MSPRPGEWAAQRGQATPAAKHFHFAFPRPNMPASIREAIMHGTTQNKRGLRAAFRSLLGALLASSPGIASSVSAADEPPPMVSITV